MDTRAASPGPIASGTPESARPDGDASIVRAGWPLIVAGRSSGSRKLARSHPRAPNARIANTQAVASAREREADGDADRAVRLSPTIDQWRGRDERQAERGPEQRLVRQRQPGPPHPTGQRRRQRHQRPGQVVRGRARASSTGCNPMPKASRLETQRTTLRAACMAKNVSGDMRSGELARAPDQHDGGQPEQHRIREQLAQERGAGQRAGSERTRRGSRRQDRLRRPADVLFASARTPEHRRARLARPRPPNT